MIQPDFSNINDKRKRGRLKTEIVITAKKEILGQEVKAKITDLNWYGAGLEIDISVHEGDELYLTIPMPGSDHLVETRAKVIWAERITEDSSKTRCGVYFVIDPSSYN